MSHASRRKLYQLKSSISNIIVLSILIYLYCIVIIIIIIIIIILPFYWLALWGGRWQDGAAATTGEEVEHINSHFSRLGCCTKHMLPEGREELLTEHAIHWSRRKIEGLPCSLAKCSTKIWTTQARLRISLRSCKRKWKICYKILIKSKAMCP